METYPNFPSYIRFCFKLITVYLLVLIFSITKSIVLPLIFATLLAIVLLRLTAFLERKRVPRSIAIIFSLITSLIVITGILYFLSSQVVGFTDNMGDIQKRLGDYIQSFQNWVSTTFHISSSQQQSYFNNMLSKIEEGGYIGTTFITITQEVVVLILLPVYTFLLLYYREKIRDFLVAVFKKTRDHKVATIINQSKGMIEGYMLGLLIEMVIVAVLTSVGVMIIGVKFAIFLGVLCAILNVIPYLGILAAAIFTMFVSLGTSNDLSDLIWISLLFLVVHNIDSNILKTIVVGSYVRINALVTIFGIIVGNALAGLAGMFLAIPTLAILKIIFDQVEDLKPWGTLLGENVKASGESKLARQIKKIKRKISR